MSESQNTLVLDLGTAITKAGSAEEALPTAVFPSVVGVPAKKTGLLLKKNKTLASERAPLPPFLVGHDALQELGRVTLSYPLEHGVVKDWSKLEQMVNFCFTEFGFNPEETSVVIAEPIFNPKSNTEQLAQILFEAFNVPQLAVIPSGICALYASGRTSGVVLDSGDGVTQVTPVFDSFILQSATNRINHGGREVTEHLRTVLFERGLSFTTTQDWETVKRIKDELCYVVSDYAASMEAAEEELTPFELPDGQTVQVGKELFRAPEILFSPTILMNELPSMQQMVSDAVKGCGIDIRKQLLSNIILSGGNTMFRGFASRLEEEVLKEFPGLFGSVNVVDVPDRMYSVWSGASVLAQLPSFANRMVARDVFDENGPSIVHGYIRASGGSDGDDEDDSDLPPLPPDEV